MTAAGTAPVRPRARSYTPILDVMERKKPATNKQRPVPPDRPAPRSQKGKLLVRKGRVLVYTGPTASLNSVEAIDQVRDERAGEP